MAKPKITKGLSRPLVASDITRMCFYRGDDGLWRGSVTVDLDQQGPAKTEFDRNNMAALPAPDQTTLETFAASGATDAEAEITS